MSEKLNTNKKDVLGLIDDKDWLQQKEIDDLKKIDSSNFDFNSELSPTEKQKFLSKLNTEFVKAYSNAFGEKEWESIAQNWSIDSKVLKDRTWSELYTLYTSICQKLWEQPNSLEFVVYSSVSMKIMSEWKTVQNKENFQKAINLQEELLQIEPNNTKVLINTWNMYTERWLINLKSNSAEDGFQSINDFKTALDYYDKAWNEPAAIANKGLVYLSMWENDKALSAYEQAFQLNPNDKLIWHNLITLYMEQGKNLEALSCMEKLFTDDAEHLKRIKDTKQKPIAEKENKESIWEQMKTFIDEISNGLLRDWKQAMEVSWFKIYIADWERWEITTPKI